jgi:mannose-6-phosphate isomerase
MLYPLKFEPRLLEKMWAGRKIQDVLGKPLPPGKNIGESWELYDFPPGVIDKSGDWVSAHVANGPLRGKTLHQLVLEHQKDLLGDVPLESPHGQFPLLIKFLDAREDLSIQVHPDRKYAAAHPEAFLKSEAWFIVQSEPGAFLYKGLKPGTTKENFRRGIHEGHCERLLNFVPVKPGDCYYLPSGTVHAVGAGILAAEVQTPSDTTFRVYDFNRIEPSTGKPRTLHVEEAMECIHFGDERPAPPRAPGEPLVRCEFFEMDEVRAAEKTERSLPVGRPIIWMILDGQISVRVNNLPEPANFHRGDTILFPASMSNPMLSTAGNCRWLEIKFPR